MIEVPATSVSWWDVRQMFSIAYALACTPSVNTPPLLCSFCPRFLLQNKKIEEARALYEKIVGQFPNAGRYWKIYIEHEVLYQSRFSSFLFCLGWTLEICQPGGLWKGRNPQMNCLSAAPRRFLGGLRRVLQSSSD